MKAYSVTDVGQVRQINQDYIFTSEQPIGNLPNIFVVADGMGGHNAGDFASRHAVKVLAESVRVNKESNPVKIMRAAMEEANRQLLVQADGREELKGMGTTMVAVTIVGGCAYVANVGDSRLYVVDEKLEQITQDHSLVGEMLRMGQLSAEQARSHPDRNIITRALGAGTELAIDFFEVKLEEDSRIILCSDGLYSMVADEEIAQVLAESCSRGGDPAFALMQRANVNGGRDNIAVIVVEPYKKEVREC